MILPAAALVLGKNTTLPASNLLQILFFHHLQLIGLRVTGERSSSMAADQLTKRNQNDANQRRESWMLDESENIEITVKNAKRKKKTHLHTEEELHCLLPSFESTSSTRMVRKARRKTQNIGVYITVLQKLVSPFGKTDTASVLHEASVYIKAMHERIKLLSKTHLESIPHDLVDQGMNNGRDQRSESLRGMGLCLVPISPLIISIVNHEPSDDCMSERVL
ncbi:Transcription factor bHLH103 [Dendrobium catenatum]|uniref:Transcription factor bHLH103 n=1 Tax=Dendrobium catenatum TaxID=906689 RepID=A0A2I0X4K7_9ASPA|nr:Transcription factor bHLH103 [Dendrobium catenatum]